MANRALTNTASIIWDYVTAGQAKATVASPINVKDYGAVGNGNEDGTGTDDSGAFQDAIDALDANRGGRLLVPQGKYRLATGLTITNVGTEIVGEGHPGVSHAYGRGSTRIIADNGVTAFTCNPTGTPHKTVGYIFRRLHIKSATSATTGNGILIKNTQTCIVDDVTCSDFIGGYGLCIDGLSENAQYTTLNNYSAGDCLTGLKLMGAGPHGVRMFGGYFEGLGDAPRANSIGIHIVTGDSFRGYGIVIQGYAKGFYLESPAAHVHELHGPRFEYCNRCIHIAGTAAGFKLVGGSMVNSILTNGATDGNIGIQVDAGATGIVIDPAHIAGTVTPILDNGTGTLQPVYEAVP